MTSLQRQLLVAGDTGDDVCIGVHVGLAFWRGGVTTLRSLYVNYLAPAVRREPPCDKRAQQRNVTVAVAQPNTRHELVLAASSSTLLVTQAEMAWGIHRDVIGASTAYFLLLREPISRLVSDFVAYRRMDRSSHPLAGATHQLSEFAPNYALRFLGNDTACPLARSRCSNLTHFDHSMRSPAHTEASCHLDYETEERYLFECALAKPNELLRANLAYLKSNMDNLFMAVGLLERLPETIALWRHIANRRDKSSWPIPACIPPPTGSTQPGERFASTTTEIKAARAANALDIELYNNVNATFDLQLKRATNEGHRAFLADLRDAKAGTLPYCRFS